MFSDRGVSVLNRWHYENCISFKSPLTSPDAAAEHQAYKDAYKQPPPPFNDDCEKLKWQLMREKALLAARMAWDAKWGSHHPEAIAQSGNAIRNIENKMKNAGCQCP